MGRWRRCWNTQIQEILKNIFMLMIALFTDHDIASTWYVMHSYVHAYNKVFFNSSSSVIIKRSNFFVISEFMLYNRKLLWDAVVLCWLYLWLLSTPQRHITSTYCFQLHGLTVNSFKLKYYKDNHIVNRSHWLYNRSSSSSFVRHSILTRKKLYMLDST